MTEILVVNFGGPRNIEEIPSFLTSLLCDQDVVRTRFPSFFHNWLFKRVAKKRAKTIAKDYELIGGSSPIYFDTETIKVELEKKLNCPVYTFHRYLPKTHAASIEEIRKGKNLKVLPLFPQFCYATTGSIARFLEPFFPNQLQWISSYANDDAFIRAYQQKINTFLKKQGLDEEKTLLLFSAHGVPKKFVEEGDPYENECNQTYELIKKAFPKATSRLCYQSKFGRGEWLKPYTDVSCETILSWNEGKENVVFIPMSFTSDHIETLFEIEKLYLPIIESKGLKAYRCPALNLEPYWIDALVQIIQNSETVPTNQLIRS